MFFYFRKLDLVVVDYCYNEFYDNLICWGFYVDWSLKYFGNFVFGVVLFNDVSKWYGLYVVFW